MIGPVVSFRDYSLREFFTRRKRIDSKVYYWVGLKQMTRRIILSFMLLVSSFSIPMMISQPALAQSTGDTIKQGACEAAGQSNCDTSTPEKSLNHTVAQIINILSAIVGVAAVIMIIVAGFRFITSGGSAEKVKSARDTVLYAIIGLIIVALAQVIVHFVVNRAQSTTNNSSSNSSTPSGPTPR